MAVVVAAGSGSRIGGEMPKQFLDLGGKPVVAHCLELFMVLPSGALLDSRGNINSERAERPNRFGDVLRCQATRHD